MEREEGTKTWRVKINKGTAPNAIGRLQGTKYFIRRKAARGEGARKEKNSWCMEDLPIYCSNCKSI